MKKITLMLFVLVAFCWQSNAQIFIQESLDSGFPANWTQVSYFTSTTADYLCEGTGNIADNMYTSAANDGSFTSPNLVGASNGTDATVEFQWLARPFTTNAVDYIIYVEYSTNDGTDWNLVTSFAVTETTPCTQYSETIAAANLPSGSDFKFRIRGEWQSGDSYFYLDNISISQIVSCPQPTSLSAASITDSSAELSWTENGSASTYNIEIVDITASGTQTMTPTATGVSNPHTYMGLLDNNDYEFYVQADCGVDGVSGWTGPFAFTTECGTFTPDYLEDFTTFLDPCWEEATGPISGPTEFGSAGWTADGFANDGSTGSARFNIYTTGGDDWLISPMFDLSGGGYEINLDVALTAFSGTAEQTISEGDAVYVMQSLDGGTTWSIIYTWDNGNSPSNTGDNLTIDISAITSATVQFAIYALEDDTSGGDMNIYIDNFQVRTPLACTAAVVDSSTEVEDCDNSQFYVDIDVTSVGNATQINDGTNTFAITGTGVLQVGPYADGSTVTLSVEHSDAACDFSLGDFTYACPPANDLLMNAIAVGCGDAVSGTTLGATQDEDDAPDTATVEDDTSADNDSPWVWYSYTGSGAADTITISTCGVANTDFDTELFVYTGTSGALTLIDDGYDECGGSAENYAAETSFTSDGTTTYYIAVGGYNADDVGNFQLSVSCASLGIDDVVNEAAFTYYPNPVKNTLTLNAQNTIEQVAMYNMLGQEVLRATPNTVDSDLDMSNLQTGTYFVKVTIGNVTETIRVIKQ